MEGGSSATPDPPIRLGPGSQSSPSKTLFQPQIVVFAKLGHLVSNECSQRF
jgi:hypothetical protein